MAEHAAASRAAAFSSAARRFTVSISFCASSAPRLAPASSRASSASASPCCCAACREASLKSPVAASTADAAASVRSRLRCADAASARVALSRWSAAASFCEDSQFFTSSISTRARSIHTSSSCLLFDPCIPPALVDGRKAAARVDPLGAGAASTSVVGEFAACRPRSLPDRSDSLSRLSAKLTASAGGVSGSRRDTKILAFDAAVRRDSPSPLLLAVSCCSVSTAAADAARVAGCGRGLLRGLADAGGGAGVSIAAAPAT
eukprot:3683428-Prymnesium_polylepis.2